MDAHREIFVVQMIQNGLAEIQFTTKIQQLAAMAVEAVMYLLVILFMGLYLAARPSLYLQSMVLMTPEPRREMVKYLYRNLSAALRWWMAGQLIIMIVTGVISGIGLWLIGAPLPVALGILAGIFQFVPIIGPIAAAVPAILLCLAINPVLAVKVTVLYLGIHALEAYFLEPFIQQKVISVPPALLLPMQLLLGTAFGLIGLAISAPICGMLMVLLKALHEHPGRRDGPGRHVLLGT
jgi:predicted PurR-regulated permease PerM